MVICCVFSQSDFSHCACRWVVIMPVMSAWALYNPAVGVGTEKKKKKPLVQLQSVIQAVISLFLCAVFEFVNVAFNGVA